MPKKVFVRPRSKGKKRTEEERDGLIAKKAVRAICQAAKKVKAFEAQRISRNIKQHRQKFEAIDESLRDIKKTEKFEIEQEKMTKDLSMTKSLDVKKYLIPLGLKKLGLGEEFQWVKDNNNNNKVVDDDDDDDKNDKQIETKSLKNESEDSDNEETKKTTFISKDNVEEDDSCSSSDEKSKNEGKETSDEEDRTLDPHCKALAERLIKNNVMITAFDSLTDDITQRRREKLAIFEGRSRPKKENNKKRKKNNNDDDDLDGVYSNSNTPQVNHRSSKTTFLSSLSGAVDEEHDINIDSEEEEEVIQQKNRPGQRARQARRQMEQARDEKKHRQKQLKAMGIKIDPSYKEEHKKQWAKKQKQELAAAAAAAAAKTYKEPNVENNKKTNKRSFSSSSSSENVHSSWEAAKLRKEKEKEIMKLPFQGKKKVFGDDGDEVLIKATTKSISTTNTSSSSSGGGNSVHPSWAAKQAQVAKLAGGFQGKKITFNNDDDN